MKRSLILAYGVASYCVAVVTILYAALFFGNIYAPRTIDSFAAVPPAEAILINVLLLTGFGLQHSGMTRPAFKGFLMRFLPGCLVRSTYVLTSSLAVVVLMAFWQPIGKLVWYVSAPLPYAMIAAVYFGGWLLIAWSSFLIDHFEMFGLRQAWAAFRGSRSPEPGFRTPGAYRVVRHPIHLGWLIVLWATPVMTVTHLLLAAGLTVYIGIGTRLEERQLVDRFPEYAQYARKVPMLVPSPRRRLDA